MDKIIVGFWTVGGIPEEGLSPTLKIIDVDTGTIVVTGDNMIEINNGFYKYDFSLYVNDENYVILMNAESDVVDQQYQSTGNESFSEEISDAVWSKETSSYQELDTFGGKLNFVKSIESGRWKLDETTNQMIFYDESNNELTRFNLFDDVGTPSTTAIFERIPV